jgi:hypothetical protein
MARKPAIAERQRDDRAVVVAAREHRVLRRVGQPDVGERDVGLVLGSDEVHPEQAADGAVRPVAAHDVPRGLSAAVGELDDDLVRVLPERDDVGALDDVHTQLTGTLQQQLLGAALRHDEDHRVPGAQLPQVDVGARRRPDLAHHDPAGHQVVAQSPGVEQLEGAGVHGERARDVRLLGAPLHDSAANTPEGEFTREHEAGRTGTDNDDIGVLHGTLLKW